MLLRADNAGVQVGPVRREFAFNRTGPGIGSHTWRYVFDPIPSGTRLTESYDAERALPKLMSWLTEKWTGSPDRDADLRRGMEVTVTHQAATENHRPAGGASRESDADEGRRPTIG